MKSERAVGWTHILPQEVNSLGEHIVSPINVVKYQLIMDETDELIKLRDYIEMDIANSRAEKIVGNLSDLILQAEQLKIDHGVSARSVRQSKKDVKARYSTFLVDKEKLAKFLNNRQEEIDEEMERRLEPKQEQQQEEECLLTELHLRHEEHERRMWQEKMDAELEETHKWLELEKEACSTTAKLPKLLITPLKGNVHQLGEIWEHVCYKSPNQIDQHRREIRLSVGNGKSKSTSKDTYVAKLKPGEFDYKIASNLSMARANL